MTDRPAILVVEDDADVREALAAILESSGYRVLEAGDGRQALERLRVAVPDVGLILLDLFMPTMNGWEFRAEQLRDPRLAAVPVVIITADATAAQRTANLGVTEFLTKPVDFDRLLDLVGRHCGL
jgi:CheY-like chemotaxis protein